MSAHALLQTAHRPELPADVKLLRRTDGRMLKESGRSGPSMPLKILIVDDEPIARKVLREELESIEGVEIVGDPYPARVFAEFAASLRLTRGDQFGHRFPGTGDHDLLTLFDLRDQS